MSPSHSQEPPKILSYPTAKKQFYYGTPGGGSQKSYTIPTMPPVYYGGKHLYQFLLILSYRCHHHPDGGQ
jgi:hypothetical protein